MVEKINGTEEFLKAIGDENTGLVLIDFYAVWCMPCRLFAPKLEKMTEEYTNIKFYKLDVDENSLAARKCQISSLPTFCLFYKGNHISEVVGTNQAMLNSMLTKYSELAKEPVVEPSQPEEIPQLENNV